MVGVRIPWDENRAVSGRLHPARDGRDAAPLLALTHGASGSMDSPALVGLAEALARRGIRVLRFNLPAAEAGRRRPDHPAVAVRAIRGVAAVARRLAAGAPFFLGGRSFGGRMVSMFLADPGDSGHGAAGAVLLAYPLKPPGSRTVPDIRVRHLGHVDVPMLFVSGDRDPFAPPELFEPVVSAAGGALRWIRDGNHGFRVAKARLAAAGRTMADVDREVANHVTAFLGRDGSVPQQRLPGARSLRRRNLAGTSLTG